MLGKGLGQELNLPIDSIDLATTRLCRLEIANKKGRVAKGTEGESDFQEVNKLAER